jgi:hypothetical protein
MKNILILTFAVLLVNTAFGQRNKEKKNVVVYVINEHHNSTFKVLRDELVAAFTRSNMYAAVDRSPAFLNSIGKEVRHAEWVNSKERLSAIKQSGAEFLCLAEVTTIAGQTYVYVALIDAENAIVAKTARAKISESSLKTVGQAFDVARIIVHQLTEKRGQSCSYFAWGILDVGFGYPFKMGTHFTARHNLVWRTGLGYYVNLGLETDGNGNTLPHWEFGAKLYPFDNLFFSLGYGTIGSEKVNFLEDHKGWQIGESRQGVIAKIGYDLVFGEKFSKKAKFFMSVSGGFHREIHSKQWNTTPLFDLKLGLVWRLK